jgi:F420-non-reducing hydrogenase small subunit
VDIVFWPVALDFKEHDVEAMPDGSILASFINGAIRNSDQLKMAKLLRAKSQVVVAFGVCAQLGGIPGLANMSDAKGIYAEVYKDGGAPVRLHKDNGHSLSLPEFYDTVVELGRVIDVDYYVPGCPPTPKIIGAALGVLLGSDLPPKGTVLAPDQALCEECPRKDTRPEKMLLKEFKRVHQVVADQQTCLLAQGLACLGPGTRAGCEALCPGGNMPCTGCFGPTSRVRDYGAKALSALASVIDSDDEAEIERVLEALPDPAGLFYRYSLPSSLLGRRRME